MDKFREWLSDNLRYIILVVGILLLLALIFFGIRAVSGVINNGEDDTKSEQDADPSENGELSTEPSESATPTAAPVDPLEKNAYPEVNTLIDTYYKALGDRDVDTLKTLVDNFDPSEEAKIKNSQYIDGYSEVEVYTKPGMTDDTYVVFAKYNYLCSGISTPVPALSQLYVVKDEAGSYKISQTAENDAEIQAYVSELMEDEDVKELVGDTQAAYDSAQESDADLKSFLDNLGNASSQTLEADEGTMLTANEGCNVRQEPNSDSEILGALEEGDQVKKTGVEGDWIQVEFDNETGYVFHSLLQ